MHGLGIGANTASFSVINATLWRGSMAAAPDRLVDVYQNGTNPRGVDANTYPAYLDMTAYTGVFESTTAASVPYPRSYRHDGALLSAIVENTTASYPSVLGLQPSLGRWFTTAEDTPGAAVVAVVGHQTWIRRFRSRSLDRRPHDPHRRRARHHRRRRSRRLRQHVEHRPGH